MFLKSLKITSNSNLIREINFRKGMNLIIDETQENELSDGTETGNSVGKTTVLQLIDFCLGANAKGIYVDPDSKKEENLLVKEYLRDQNILITLILKDDLDVSDSTEVTIQRNFLSRNQIIRRINEKNYTEDEFEIELLNLIFPNHNSEKPTFRQIISHNIRYKDENINSTLRTLDKYTSDAEYETLHLFMLGIDFGKGNEKQNLIAKLKQEDSFRVRLEKSQTKTAYETTLAIIENDIEKLNIRKSNFNLNENFEADLDKLNQIKYQINKTSSELTNLKIKRDLINEAEIDLKSNFSDIDIQQLQAIYQQATQRIEGIQKSFDDLVNYHNQMINEKVEFIKKEMPELEKKISSKSFELQSLLIKEKSQSQIISKSESFEELEILILDLNEKYRKKGEYENIIQQLNEVEDEMKDLNQLLEKIDDTLFSEEFELKVKSQLKKFNSFFANVSETLYGEQYALKYDIVTNKKRQRLYKFSAFNTNFSSGKKQGEISCFDIAYVMFADTENIPTLHFLLNDKKELMHNNQLVKIAELVDKTNIQFVASILQDKLPDELNKEEYFVVKLSQVDKLFRIENSEEN
ncbi:hypothetical protein IA01_09570 [Flavobacterium psychrophilum]|uniref:DUF2326 domain-containing protein n=8 Tax=Flavobacterium psychrophilum TaxID=96345 RepID=A6H0Z1_FLAPJ|nr:DUF2326 domain-containing protein [Flavobacterium psychrophilum]AIG30697.1 hypothetical protein IA03_09535 [Flavobacterium psychrophilum]AIG32972.1 hypothetical protein IA01_09570 [Flavobacterium psychrophilum]AIG35127.1 hypothetical protein IA02_08955 [Flavobacterium psychrophilum]AIG37492.1 hypothetical protein IA04_09475 [Flavobacterium psychrophilum]AIG39756.1 hypothetical protein IA05_09545 [Flavobacterium psychrophilum]